MEKYEEMVQTIFQTLQKYGYRNSTLCYYGRCYAALKIYLVEKNILYSPGDAEEWYHSLQDDLSDTHKSMFRAALLKLRDVFNYGYVLPEHINTDITAYLSDENQTILDEYFLELSSKFVPVVCSERKSIIASFLLFTEDHACPSYLQFSYEVIQLFFFRITEKPLYIKQREDRVIHYFLLWLYERKLCTYGFSILLHYLQTNNDSGWLKVSDSVLSEMQTMNETAVVNPATLPSIIMRITSDLKKQNYNNDSISPYRRILEMLFLFLDQKNLNYSREIAVLWLANIHINFQKEGRIERRALRILDDHINNIPVVYENLYRYKPSKVDALPDWCRFVVSQFLDMKQKEGMKYSTVAMFRSSVVRFCNFLDSKGITSFEELTAEDIKAFHKQDCHKTPEGKNAYNIRIRAFVKYLSETELISNPFLYFSVPRESVDREVIVVTLTEDEKRVLKEQLRSDNLSLRDKAIIMLGYRLGIRETDIAELDIGSIDWTNSSIRFIQQKTGVEITLPLTPDVGNALYRYIMEERLDSPLSKVFLRERAPYVGTTRTICTKAMNRTFPDKNVSGSGFHVLRKTMATELLRKDVSMQMVSDFLGHKNNETVMEYLSLDDERMRKCGISLREANLEFRGELFHA